MTSERMAAVAAMVDSWYWQVQEQGKWRYKYHTEVMVRYYEAAPLEADVFPEVIEFLQKQTNLTTLQLHGKTVTLSGVWDTNRVWYETRDGDTSETNKLKRVRIYQALVKDCGDKAADGPYTVENGCRWNVAHTFHWQVPALPSLPASSSGVNYQMQGVTRDQDTGLFNCVIEKRTRVQQDVAEYASEKTVFENRSEEMHLGVKQEAVSGTGKAASAGGGQLVTRKVSKNEDCTSDVQNVTVDEVPVSGAVVEKRRTLRGTETTTTNRNQANKANDSALAPGQSVRNELTPGGSWTQTIRTFTASALGWLRRACRATMFDERDSVTSVVGEDPGFTHQSVSLGEGKTKEISVTRTEDGAFEVEEATVTEKGVSRAVVTVEKDLDGITETTVNRNASAPVGSSGLGIGESVRNEVTEGGKYNTTVRHVSAVSVGQKSKVVQDSSLEKTTRTVENQLTAGSGGGSSSPGTIVVNGYTMTQRGTFDCETSERVAKEVSDNFSGGTMKRKVSGEIKRNSTQSINESSPGQNQSIDVSESINEFGLKDTVKRTTTYEEQKSSIDCGSELVDVRVETCENSANEPQVQAGSQGKITEASCSMNDRGSYDWRKTERTAKEVSASFSGGTMKRKIAGDIKRNTTQEVQEASPGKNQAIEVSESINEFGLKDTVKRTTTYEEQKAIVDCGSKLVDVHMETCENSDNEPQVKAGEEGKITEASCSMNDRGSYDWRKTERTAKAAEKEQTWNTEDDDYTYTYKLVVYRNKTEPMVPSDGTSLHASVSFSINEFGLYDGHYLTTNRSDKGGGGGGGSGSQWDDKCNLTGYLYFQKGDGELYRMPYTCLLSMKKSTMKEMIQHCKGGENCRPLGWVSGIQNGVAYCYSKISTTGKKEKVVPKSGN